MRLGLVGAAGSNQRLGQAHLRCRRPIARQLDGLLQLNDPSLEVVHLES
jgi:hypothetical protein